MVRRALALMVAVAVVGAVVGMVGVLGPRPVEAQPTSTRSFSADTVAPGGQLMVTVEVGGYGAFGGLTEMLPEGFTYVSSSPSTTPEADGRLIFVLSGEMEVTYTVAAPFTPSMYTFTGTVTKVSLSEQVPDEDEPVIGDTVVTVELDPSPEPTPSFSATRSFNPASVAPGDPVEVTIMARGYGSFGQVVETLPAEFSYVSSSLGEDAEESGLVATFTLLEDPKTFTYTVTAPSTSGRHTFRGIVENSDFDSQPVGGDEVVTVEQPSFSATRSFNPASVAPGDPVEVTIMARGYGSFGQVVETLPAEFSYVSSSLGEDAEESGLVATFTLLEDPKTFTYTVTAPSTSGRHTFRGIVENSDFDSQPVGGDEVVTVEQPSFSATRSFNPASVAPGDPVEVTIMARGYGSFGQVVETLPAEFSYVSSSLGEDAEESGLVATFTLLEDPKTFTYTVTAPSTSGRHTFRGIVENSDFDSQPVGGDEVVTVEQPSFSATRSFNPASVAPGDPVEVTIMARGYGSFGQVVETLPAGFSYVSSSLGEDAEESGLVATFTLLEDPKTFTYTVTAPSTSGRYTFRGIVDNSDFERKTFDSRITVGTPPTTPTPTVAPTPTAAPPLVPTAAPPAAVEPTAPVTAPVAPPAAPPAAPEDEGGLPTWAIVLIIIVAVVLAVGGGLFAFVRGRR